MYQRNLASIIVPAYNEEKLLPVFLKKITIALKKLYLDYELLIIENGSTDKTLKIAKEAEEENKKIKIHHLAYPSYGKALKFGLLKARGEYLIIFNVDFWNMAFLRKCLPLLKSYDLVVGSKLIHQAADKRPINRRLISYFFNLFLKIIFGFKGTDTHGLKSLRTELIIPILKKCQTEGEILDTELILRAQRENLKIKEIPVKVKEIRPSRYNLWKKIPGTIRDLIKLKEII